MKPFKTMFRNTFSKYLFTYFFLSLILITGFLFIIKNQFATRFYEQRSEQLQLQLSHTQEWLNIYFSTITTTYSSLQTNLHSIEYKTEDSRNYSIYKELKNFDNSSTLISAIAYKPENSSIVISSKFLITFTDNTFYILDNTISSLTISDGTVMFDASAYLNSLFDQFIIIQNDSYRYLIYFPSTKSLEDSVCFFILDIDEIEEHLRILLSQEAPAVALINADKQFITDINNELLQPYIDSIPLVDGVYSPDSSTSIHVQTGVRGEFTLVALMSRDSFSRQINTAFSNAYLFLLLLSIICFFLILLFMHITYTPLKQLSAKFIPGSVSSRDHIQELDIVFDKTLKLNQTLEQKLLNYRDFMRNSLLNTITTQASSEPPSFPDHFFDTNIPKEIFVIHIMSPAQALPFSSIKAFFQTALPGNDSCIVLETGTSYATFLVIYTGTEPHKSETLKELLYSYYESNGYLSTLSAGTASPLDIPSLYTNVIKAAGNRSKELPVLDLAAMPPITSFYDYPHHQLEQFTIMLSEQNFNQCKLLISEILQLISNTLKEADPVHVFYTTSILLDMLTSIVISMNQFQIDFASYEDLYHETLYYCRSCSYHEVTNKIKSNLFRFLEIYEQEFNNKALSVSQVIQFMEENYCDPNFSISVLAEKCHVSIAYMSYLFKKELDQNFSDRLWLLRLSKAEDLLANTDMAIDDISTALGYLNPSSFYRKFKKETGITPSQFRANMRHTV